LKFSFFCNKILVYKGLFLFSHSCYLFYFQTFWLLKEVDITHSNPPPSSSVLATNKAYNLISFIFISSLCTHCSCIMLGITYLTNLVYMYRYRLSFIFKLSYLPGNISNINLKAYFLIKAILFIFGHAIARFWEDYKFTSLMLIMAMLFIFDHAITRRWENYTKIGFWMFLKDDIKMHTPYFRVCI